MRVRAFWTETPVIYAAMADIAARSDEASSLWFSLSHLIHRDDVARVLVQELTAACFRDGLSADYETVRSLVIGRRPPESSQERLVVHAAGLFYDLVDRSKELLHVDIPFMRGLYSRLTTGAEDIYAIPYLPKHPPQGKGARGTNDDLLASIAVNHSDELAWGTNPAYGVVLNADIIWDSRPFEHFNGLMEFLVRVASFRRFGFHCLCFVPLSSMRLDWERDLVSPSIAPFRWGEAIVESSHGIDSTPYLECMVGFLQEGICRLEGLVRRIERADTTSKRRINCDGRLNYRQRDLLMGMVDNPSREIDVHEYQVCYGVVASTARIDLNRLVTMRLLNDGFRGRKQVFWIRSDMTDNLVGE